MSSLKRINNFNFSGQKAIKQDFGKVQGKKSIAQGTVEYLVIISVVIVLSLVVVGMIIAQVDSSQQVSNSSNALGLFTQVIGVTESLVNPDGNFVVRLLNNSGENITISNVKVGDISVAFSEDLAQGSNKFFQVSTSEVCSEGKVISQDVIVSYLTKDGLSKVEKYPAKVMFNCSDYIVNVNLLANSCVSQATTVEPNLLPQYISSQVSLFGITGYLGTYSGQTACAKWNGSSWTYTTNCNDINVMPDQDALVYGQRDIFIAERVETGVFEDGNKYVIDKWNNLMWWDGNSVTYMDWNNAIYYCDNFTAGGYNDWRLPTVSEAFSSFDYGAAHNSGSHSCLKGITDCFGNQSKPPLWTSTNFASNTGYAYVYYPADGSITNTLRTGLKLVRCIRFNE